MVKTLEIKDRELVDYIESLQYEVNARRDIISFMLSRDMEMSTSAFKRYHNEYEEFLVQFEEAKRQLETLYIGDDIKAELGCDKINWDLNFESGMLTLRGAGLENK